MKTALIALALSVLSLGVARADTFPDLAQFFQALRQQPVVATPLGAPADEGELTLVKGAPVPNNMHCDLIERPGDRQRHVCSFRCDAYGEIVTRPAERIPAGRGAAERPDCYRALVTPKR